MSGGDSLRRTALNVSNTDWSGLCCHLTQSRNRPSMRPGKPSKTSLRENTSADPRLASEPDLPCLTGSNTANEPSTRAYRVRPGIVGRFLGAGQTWPAKSKCIVVLRPKHFCRTIANVIVGSDFPASVLGYACFSAHCPVRLHQAHSSRNVFPRPLSPVMTESRSPGLNSRRLLGPTPARARYLSVPPSSGLASGAGSINRNKFSSE